MKLHRHVVISTCISFAVFNSSQAKIIWHQIMQYRIISEDACSYPIGQSFRLPQIIILRWMRRQIDLRIAVTVFVIFNISDLRTKSQILRLFQLITARAGVFRSHYSQIGWDLLVYLLWHEHWWEWERLLHDSSVIAVGHWGDIVWWDRRHVFRNVLIGIVVIGVLMRGFHFSVVWIGWFWRVPAWRIWSFRWRVRFSMSWNRTLLIFALKLTYVYHVCFTKRQLHTYCYDYCNDHQRYEMICVLYY